MQSNPEFSPFVYRIKMRFPSLTLLPSQILIGSIDHPSLIHLRSILVPFHILPSLHIPDHFQFVFLNSYPLQISYTSSFLLFNRFIFLTVQIRDTFEILSTSDLLNCLGLKKYVKLFLRVEKTDIYNVIL